MECTHPEAFVSVKNGKRICGICGQEAPVKQEEKPAKGGPKKGGKANARK